MSGAQSWNVKGIDPKVREAAREAAERQGMTVAEYLNFALANHAPQGGQPNAQRTRTLRALNSTRFDEDGEDGDWDLSSSSPQPRTLDPARLAQRLEAIERRTQLAVTGLDRAVSTIDRSVLGLAARIEDAEAVSGESAERVAEALEHFRIAGDTLGGRLERAEEDAEQSRRALDAAKSDLLGVRARLENQVAIAEEVARRAEAAASFLTTEMESRNSAHARTLTEARQVAEEAARQATQASSDAVAELRLLQEQMSERLAETETSTRRVIETAIQEVRAETAGETRGAREALLEEVVRLESEIAKRVGAIEQLKGEQSTLIARIERAEAGARESTAGLRQAAGAAIADLRNAQLALAARVKQVEDSGAGGGVDLTDVRQQQQDIGERLVALERKTETSPVTDALAAFEARLSHVEQTASAENQGDNEAVATLDNALRRLADRIAETESTANTAIRTLEETVSSLGARMEQKDAAQETEAVRAVLEERLSQMVGDARAELAGQLQAALEGSRGEGFDEALADVNRRLAAAERRQAQTIEAISLEIRRMSETVDKRLRTVEARNDDAAAAAVREELSRMATTLEQRFDEIETREAAAFDRMGLEVGRLSERLEERFGAVEKRSAQAIEQVGEQVARMAERFNQRQETLARDMGERMLDSEERAGARVAEAIGSIMQRLAEVEANSAEAIAPVQKAVSSVASKLERYESGRDFDAPAETLPTPTRRAEDLDLDLGDYLDVETPYVSPMEAAQPLRAGPLTPQSHVPAPTPEHSDDQDGESDDLDIYFSEEDKREHLQFEDQAHETAPPPPLDFEQNLDDLLVEDEPSPTSAGEATAQEETLWAEDDQVQEQGSRDRLPTFDGGDEEPALADMPATSASAPSATPTPEPPINRNDYLAVARRAAQAQSAARAERTPTPRLSLRGSSRIILWGAATAVVALLAGGAWYMNTQPETGNAPAASGARVSPAAAARAAEAAAQASASAAPGENAEQPAGVDDGLANSQEPVVAGPLAPVSASLEQAAQSGDLTAQYELALQRLSAGRTQEGVTLLRRAADRGFAMAQYRLAKLYERGEGVNADLAVARQWTERAAAGGNRRAMHDLGVYFARGEGAPLDEAAAFRWFRQAAELGVADSQYNLGVLYQQGRGVNASPSEALFWFLVASRQGDQDASARATALEAQLPQPQAQQARARAQAFRPRAASASANGEFSQRTAAGPVR